jgi:CheY-like chemotaxis protein
MALALCPLVPDINGPGVLLIGDDPVVRDSVQALLEYFGYECGIAADGPGGLKRFEGETWDLVITDRRCPESRAGRSSMPPVAVYQGCP